VAMALLPQKLKMVTPLALHLIKLIQKLISDMSSEISSLSFKGKRVDTSIGIQRFADNLLGLDNYKEPSLLLL
jgi:hypothetical protein